MKTAQFIIVTGPESSGKSTLCDKLSLKYSIPQTEEVARWYLKAIGTDYSYGDVVEIARIQARTLLNHRFHSAGIVIADTWMIVIRVWLEYRFKKCDNWIQFLPKLYNDAHYLLCTPDIPWQYDEQRENPDDRWELFEIYKETLEDLNLKYSVVKGEGKNRLEIGSNVIEKYRAS